jgi:hypothetical protein
MYLPRTGQLAAPVLTPPVLTPGYRIRDGFSLVDVIEAGTEEFVGCPTTPAANLQLLDSYPHDDDTFRRELNGLYIDHLTAHAVYVGGTAVWRQEKRTPRTQPELDVPASTIRAVAIGSVLVHGQILRIEEMEARYGQAGGRRPLWHTITGAVHYKDGSLQRLVEHTSPGTFLNAQDFVDATNKTITPDAKKILDEKLDHTPGSATRAAIISLVAGQVATERDVFNQAMQSLR